MNPQFLFFIITIFSFILSLICIAENTKISEKIGYVSITICVYSFILLLCTIDKPNAIDVYRNKTTLEIIYKDSIPIDSTVVYK